MSSFVEFQKGTMGHLIQYIRIPIKFIKIKNKIKSTSLNI